MQHAEPCNLLTMVVLHCATSAKSHLGEEIGKQSLTNHGIQSYTHSLEDSSAPKHAPHNQQSLWHHLWTGLWTGVATLCSNAQNTRVPFCSSAISLSRTPLLDFTCVTLRPTYWASAFLSFYSTFQLSGDLQSHTVQHYLPYRADFPVFLAATTIPPRLGSQLFFRLCCSQWQLTLLLQSCGI